MEQLFFILGKNPTLSVSEIIAVLDAQKTAFKISVISKEALILTFPADPPDMVKLMGMLGGTVKIGKVVQQIKLDSSETEFEKIFSEENLTNKYLLPSGGNKQHVGISLYSLDADHKIILKMESMLPLLNKTVKENLKKAGVRVGFVRVKDRFLSSVSVEKNGLLSKGFEMVMLVSYDTVYCGKTIAVQQFSEFSFRDYSRPERDKRSGILPPKLARIMINLSHKPSPDSVLLDPFCGSGTVIQEAILLGYNRIYGTDISDKAIESTRKNILWLFRNFRSLDYNKYTVNLKVQDVRFISRVIRPGSIDAVVTEPYLGPPLYKQPVEREIIQIFHGLEPLYKSAFSEFFTILKPGGTIIIAVPAFQASAEYHFMQIIPFVLSLGFKQIDFLSDDNKNNPVLSVTERNSVVYGDKEHYVKREILSFQKG